MPVFVPLKHQGLKVLNCTVNNLKPPKREVSLHLLKRPTYPLLCKPNDDVFIFVFQNKLCHSYGRLVAMAQYPAAARGSALEYLLLQLELGVG